MDPAATPAVTCGAMDQIQHQGKPVNRQPTRTTRPLRIGLSAALDYPDEHRRLFKDRILLYAEESMLRWLMTQGALPVLIPRPSGSLTLADLLADVDALLLQGGTDVAPSSYGEEPLQPAWNGDAERDQYEISLIHACLERDIPLLGICRGIQILNVALGGTLYQDIRTAMPTALVHRDWDQYDRLSQDVKFTAGSHLQQLYGVTTARINSVHHQAIKQPGRQLIVEARSPADGIIEAVRLETEAATYALGIQWHPEFQLPEDTDLLDPAPLLQDFLRAARQRAG